MQKSMVRRGDGRWGKEMNKESAGKNKGKIEGKKLFKLLTCTKYILVF